MQRPSIIPKPVIKGIMWLKPGYSVLIVKHLKNCSLSTHNSGFTREHRIILRKKKSV